MLGGHCGRERASVCLHVHVSDRVGNPAIPRVILIGLKFEVKTLVKKGPNYPVWNDRFFKISPGVSCCHMGDESIEIVLAGRGPMLRTAETSPSF